MRTLVDGTMKVKCPECGNLIVKEAYRRLTPLPLIGSPLVKCSSCGKMSNCINYLNEHCMLSPEQKRQWQHTWMPCSFLGLFFVFGSIICILTQLYHPSDDSVVMIIFSLMALIGAGCILTGMKIQKKNNEKIVASDARMGDAEYARRVREIQPEEAPGKAKNGIAAIIIGWLWLAFMLLCMFGLHGLDIPFLLALMIVLMLSLPAAAFLIVGYSRRATCRKEKSVSNN